MRPESTFSTIQLSNSRHNLYLHFFFFSLLITDFSIKKLQGTAAQKTTIEGKCDIIRCHN